MKKGMAVLALVGVLCAGCARGDRSCSYRTDVLVRPSDTPQQYVVEFKVLRARPDRPESETDLLAAPKLTVRAGHEAEVKVCDEKEENGFFCKALVKEDGAAVNAVTRTVVKVAGKETHNSSQNIALARGKANTP